MQGALEEKLGAIEYESRNVDVQWNNMNECVLDAVSDLVVEVKREQESPGLCRQLSVLWMSEAYKCQQQRRKEEL